MTQSTTHRRTRARCDRARSENLSDEKIARLLRAGGCLEWISLAAALSRCCVLPFPQILETVYQTLAEDLRAACSAQSVTSTALSRLRDLRREFDFHSSRSTGDRLDHLWSVVKECRLEDDVLALLRDNGVYELEDGVVDVKRYLMENLSSAESRVLALASWLYSTDRDRRGFPMGVEDVFLYGYLDDDLRMPLGLPPEVDPRLRLAAHSDAGEPPISLGEMASAMQERQGDAETPRRRLAPRARRMPFLPDDKTVLSLMERTIEDTSPVEIDFAEDCLVFLAEKFGATEFSRTISELRVEDFLGKPRSEVIDWLARWLAGLDDPERCASLLCELRGSDPFDAIQLVDRDGKHFVRRVGCDAEVDLSEGDFKLFEKLLQARGGFVTFEEFVGKIDEDEKECVRKKERDRFDHAMTKLRNKLKPMRIGVPGERGKKRWKLVLDPLDGDGG